MDAIREKLLRGTASDFGITPQGDVWGVLMEMGASTGTATLVSLADGTTSLYLSTGGGVIGGGEHAEVAEASVAFCKSSGEAARSAAAARTFESPASGKVRFYFLTTSGPRWAEAPEAELRSEATRNPLAPLYRKGHVVLGRLRERTQSRGADPPRR